ncbi:putative crown gall tumor protein VirC1 [Jannaschia rubra]|uniref:Putative crown gall tumor protein VirC1 n=2 Tax=Jannaschia rubra TaxID=282197 RepID=A0A0M6XWZ9_9RHOB|nr:putative crown gall tumor protein VirC1 [Jannaschia rubra]
MAELGSMMKDSTVEDERVANDDMKVITVMTRKGGAGKTTLTQALMSAAVSRGKRCLALDADPQQGLHRWLDEYARDEPLVTYRQLEFAEDLEAAANEAYEAGEVDLIFVDTQGAAGAWADELAAQSDVLVVPMKLGKTDYLITIDTVNWYSGLLDRIDQPELAPPLRVVVSGATAKPTVTEKEFETLAVENFPVLPTYFMFRKQHLDAAAGGFLHNLAEAKRTSKNGLERSHVKHFDEAVQEASDILDEIMGEI